MSAFVKDTLVDSDEYVVLSATAPSAVSRESILDVSGLSGGSATSIVYIEEIQWSSAGLLTIDYGATDPQKVLELTYF